MNKHSLPAYPAGQERLSRALTVLLGILSNFVAGMEHVRFLRRLAMVPVGGWTRLTMGVGTSMAMAALGTVMLVYLLVL
jgi:hypothetical protein